jgi:peptide/nickel transport system substrate-binding protein
MFSSIKRKTKKKLAFLTITLLILFASLNALNTTTSVGAQDATPKYGGTLIAAHDADRNIMPNYEYARHIGSALIYDALLDMVEPTGEIVFNLAESVDVSEDGLNYTFHLRQNVTWHDGEKFTADDVKWSYDSVIQENAYFAPSLEDLDRIEIVDDYTVKFILNKVNGAFLSVIARGTTPVIYPEHLWAGTNITTNPYKDSPVGTGPFYFVEHKRGEHLIVNASEDYHFGRPYLDQVIIKIIPSWPTIIAALLAGEVHVTFFTAAYSEIDILDLSPIIDVGRYERAIPMWLGFNLEREPFNNTMVREALIRALNFTDINQKVYNGKVPTSNCSYLSKSWAYNPNATQPTYDPELAEELLDDAGYTKGPDGWRFSLTVTGYTSMGVPEICEVAKEYWRAIGIDAKRENIKWASFVQKVINDKDFDICNAGGVQGPDPIKWHMYIMTGGYRNAMNYSNSRVDELCNLATQTTNQTLRKIYYQEVQEIIAEELPRINIAEIVDYYTYNNEYAGWQWDQGLTTAESMRHVWWTKYEPPAPPASLWDTYAPYIVIVIVVVVGGAIGVYYMRRKK